MLESQRWADQQRALQSYLWPLNRRLGVVCLSPPLTLSPESQKRMHSVTHLALTQGRCSSQGGGGGQPEAARLCPGLGLDSWKQLQGPRHPPTRDAVTCATPCGMGSRAELWLEPQHAEHQRHEPPRLGLSSRSRPASPLLLCPKEQVPGAKRRAGGVWRGAGWPAGSQEHVCGCAGHIHSPEASLL